MITKITKTFGISVLCLGAATAISGAKPNASDSWDVIQKSNVYIDDPVQHLGSYQVSVFNICKNGDHLQAVE